MTEINLTEGRWSELELTGAQVGELRAANLVNVRSGSRRGLWRVRATKFVGAVRLGPAAGGMELRIAPKIKIDRLLFLIGYARQQQRWQQDEIEVREAACLLPVAAHAFARAADRALRQGVLLGYHEVEAALPVVVGRVREADQVRRRPGLALPVELAYQDSTLDIAENQLLLAAASRLLRLPGLYGDTRMLLRHVLVRLDGVSRLVPGRPRPPWHPTRLNRRYQTALGLAELVLGGASYELDDIDGERSIRADGLLVLNMWKVFEDFVAAGLAEALRRHGGECTAQDTRHHLDHAHLFQLIPDLVYDRPGPDCAARPAAVIDAKYIVATGSAAHRDHLYQILAYCVALGVRRGYLVYAEGPDRQVVHRMQGAQIELVQYPLDLSVPPAALLAQLAKLAENIAAIPSPA